MLDLSDCRRRLAPADRGDRGHRWPGVDELLEAVEGHRAWAEAGGRLAARRAERLWEEVESIVAARLGRRAQRLLGEDGLAELHQDVAARSVDPWSASDRILQSVR